MGLSNIIFPAPSDNHPCAPLSGYSTYRSPLSTFSAKRWRPLSGAPSRFLILVRYPRLCCLRSCVHVLGRILRVYQDIQGYPNDPTASEDTDKRTRDLNKVRHEAGSSHFALGKEYIPKPVSTPARSNVFKYSARLRLRTILIWSHFPPFLMTRS